MRLCFRHMCQAPEKYEQMHKTKITTRSKDSYVKDSYVKHVNNVWKNNIYFQLLQNCNIIVIANHTAVVSYIQLYPTISNSEYSVIGMLWDSDAVNQNTLLFIFLCEVYFSEYANMKYACTWLFVYKPWNCITARGCFAYPSLWMLDNYPLGIGAGEMCEIAFMYLKWPVLVTQA